jgi:hypothetical protein
VDLATAEQVPTGQATDGPPVSAHSPVQQAPSRNWQHRTRWPAAPAALPVIERQGRRAKNDPTNRSQRPTQGPSVIYRFPNSPHPDRSRPKCRSRSAIGLRRMG